MSNLINPKPRFGLNLEANTMFDYVSSRDVPVTALYQGSDGQWNLETVKKLILAGKTIETAKLNNTVPPKPTATLQPAPAKAPAPTAKAPAPTAKPAPAAAQPKPASGAPAPANALAASTAANLATSKAAVAAAAANKLPSTGVAKGARHGLTAPQIQALQLQPLQLAALGIGPKTLKVDGLTADQVAAMKITSERAKRLGLTPAQEMALTA